MQQKKKTRFFSMLMAALGAGFLGNILAGRGFNAVSSFD